MYQEKMLKNFPDSAKDPFKKLKLIEFAKLQNAFKILNEGSALKVEHLPLDKNIHLI